MLAAFGFTLWTVEVLPFVMIGALVVYLLGVPAWWVVTRRGGAPVRRHVVAGVAVGVQAAAVLARLLGGGLLGWPVVAVFSIGLGVPLAAGAAAFGLVLPRRWVEPVGVVGLLVTAVVLPAGT